MRKLLRLVLGIIACGVFLYSGYQIYDYFAQANVSASLTQSLADQAVMIHPPGQDADPMRPSVPEGEEETVRLIQQAAAQSLFQSDVEIAQGDRFLTLSTCSYEYDDARFVLIGKLTPLD